MIHSHLTGSNCVPATQETRWLRGVRTGHDLWYRMFRAAVAAETLKQEELRSCVWSDRNV
jgi:hypothetical protein